MIDKYEEVFLTADPKTSEVLSFIMRQRDYLMRCLTEIPADIRLRHVFMDGPSDHVRLQIAALLQEQVNQIIIKLPEAPSPKQDEVPGKLYGSREMMLDQLEKTTESAAGKMPSKVFDHTEKVNHPPHYGGDTVYEVIKVIEAWGLGFNLGNTIKYVGRAGKKHRRGASVDDRKAKLEDLRKAQWYLNREIESLSSTTATSK